MATQRQKFASQASPELLQQMREIAHREGRQFQAVMEDAMREYIETKNNQTPRRHMMAYFEESLEKYNVVYERLAQ